MKVYPSAALTLLADVTGDYLVETMIDLNLGGYTLGGKLIIGESGSIVLENGVLESDVWNNNLLYIHSNLRVHGAIKQGGTVAIGAPLMGGLKIEDRNVTIESEYIYTLKREDLANVKLLLLEGEVKYLTRSGIAFGKLTIDVGSDEHVYDGNRFTPPVNVSIGDYVLGSSEYEIEWPEDMINPGTKTFTVELLGAMTESGEVKFTAECEIKKATLYSNNVSARLPYGEDLTVALVTGDVFTMNLHGEATGTWGKVFTSEDGKYYVTFTPERADLYESLTVEITEDNTSTLAVGLTNPEMEAPAWIVSGQNTTPVVKATNSVTGDEIVFALLEIEYWYLIEGSGTWLNSGVGMPINISEVSGKKIYIKAVIPATSDKWHGTETPVYELTVKNDSEVLKELDDAIAELDKLIAEGDADINEINAVLAEVEERLTALEGLDISANLESIKGTVDDIDARLTEAENKIATLEASVAELNKLIAKDGTIDEINAALAEVKAALDNLDGTGTSARLEAVETATETLSAAVAAINAKLAKLDGVQGEIDNIKAELEAKDYDDEIGKLNVTTIVVCVIAVIGVCGNVALLAWIIISKRKKIAIETTETEDNSEA